MPMPYLLLQTLRVPAIALKGHVLLPQSPIRGKAILFSTAGILVYITGIRDMNKMGGLAAKMPLTALLWIFGALILSALPPLAHG